MDNVYLMILTFGIEIQNPINEIANQVNLAKESQDGGFIEMMFKQGSE